jgi:hypothetical protein
MVQLFVIHFIVMRHDSYRQKYTKFAIPFDSKVKKIDKVEGAEVDKGDDIKLGLFVDPDRLACKES